jgi:predicted transcriptional regulator
MSTIESQISAMKESVSTQLSEAEKLCQKFIEETSIFLQDSYRQVAKSIGLSQPEVSQKLGSQGIEKLMGDIDALKKKTEEICNRNLRKSSAWRHLSWEESDRYSSCHKRGSHYISGELSSFQNLAHHFYDCVGPFGDVLHRAGFSTGQKGEYYGSYAASESVPHPTVVGLFKWTDELKSIATEYKKVETELFRLDRELKELVAQKARDDSEDLWKSI